MTFQIPDICPLCDGIVFRSILRPEYFDCINNHTETCLGFKGRKDAYIFLGIKGYSAHASAQFNFVSKLINVQVNNEYQKPIPMIEIDFCDKKDVARGLGYLTKLLLL